MQAPAHTRASSAYTLQVPTPRTRRRVPFTPGPRALTDGCGTGHSTTSQSFVEHPVERLSRLVESQQRQLNQQQEQIRELQRLVQQAHGSGSTWPGSPARSRQGLSPFQAQAVGIGDRRLLGLYDARFHSTSWGATPRDFRILPDKIVLVRHAESEGNVNNTAYSQIPDNQIPLSARGMQQAREAGLKLKSIMEAGGASPDYRLFFFLSPYKRSFQTYEQLVSVFEPSRIAGVQEEVQLREQDFGNFQDPQGKQLEQAERLRFGRFYYRFPDGESGWVGPVCEPLAALVASVHHIMVTVCTFLSGNPRCDVYDRLTIYEDHLIRDINAGRYANGTTLVLVTHGLALRIFLMRWFHWTVSEFLQVYNPPNAEPLVLERVTLEADAASVAWKHTKALYRLTPQSMGVLKGCTDDMCLTDHLPRMEKFLKRSAGLSDDACEPQDVGNSRLTPSEPAGSASAVDTSAKDASNGAAPQQFAHVTSNRS